MTSSLTTADLMTAIERAADLCGPAAAMDTNWRLGEAVELTGHAVAAFAPIDDLDAISDEEHDEVDRISERAHDAITHSGSMLTTAEAWRDRMSGSEWAAVQAAYRGVRILRLVWQVAVSQPGAEQNLARLMREG